MAATTVLSVRISAETKAKLDELAASARRSRSFLAEQAIADYVAHELAIVRKIMAGVEDAEAGRTSPHDAVMAEMEQIIQRAEARRAADAA